VFSVLIQRILWLLSMKILLCNYNVGLNTQTSINVYEIWFYYKSSHIHVSSFEVHGQSEFKFKYLRLSVYWNEFSIFYPHLDVYISAYIE
jgi:hypothetical protein